MVRLGLLTLALAACSDPSISIELSFADPMLTSDGVTVTVSVIDAESAGATLAPPRTAICDDVAFGLIPPEVLEGARRASVAASGGARISGIPRLGEKLVVVEAKSRNGLRVGAGCRPLGTVEDDTAVAVDVEIAPRVQQLGRMSDDPRDAAVLASAPWDDRRVLEGVEVWFQLYGTSGGTTPAPLKVMTAAEGTAAVAGLPDGGNLGPLQTLVRVKWADEPVRIAGFNAWDPILDASGDSIRFASSERLPVQWVTGPVTLGSVALPWMALALLSRVAGDADEIVAVYVDMNGRLVQSTVPVPGVRAIALWDDHAWAVLPDGWYELVAGGLPPASSAPDDRGRATELVVVKTCSDEPLGILVRRGPGAFLAYTQPGTVAPETSPLTALAAQIGNDRVVGQVCAEGPDQLERLVIVQTGSLLRVVRIKTTGVVTGRPFFLPAIATLGDFRVPGKRGLAGAISTQGGPRVQSFRIGQFTLNGLAFDAAVATIAVDLPIATAPTAIVVADLDADARLDVLALLPTATGSRIQAVMGVEIAGQPLAAVTDAIPSTRGAAQTARMALEQVDDEACLELVVLSDDGLDVFRGKVLGPDGQAHCPKRAP